MTITLCGITRFVRAKRRRQRGVQQEKDRRVRNGEVNKRHAGEAPNPLDRRAIHLHPPHRDEGLTTRTWSAGRWRAPP
jgi:hypothetical protein